jgi:hypothetical protein
MNSFSMRRSTSRADLELDSGKDQRRGLWIAVDVVAKKKSASQRGAFGLRAFAIWSSVCNRLGALVSIRPCGNT